MFVNFKAAIYDDDRESCNRVTFFRHEMVFQLLWYKIWLKKKKREKIKIIIKSIISSCLKMLCSKRRKAYEEADRNSFQAQ